MDSPCMTSIDFVNGIDPICTHWDTPLIEDFNFRFAVIQNTYRKDSVDMYFDEELMHALLEYLKLNYSNAEINAGMYVAKSKKYKEVKLDDFLDHYKSDDSEPLAALIVRVDQRMVLFIQIEMWCNCGGPFPYHDSYTYAFYSREDISENIITYLKGFNKWNISSNIYQAPTTKNPYLTYLKISIGIRKWFLHLFHRAK